MIGGSRIYDRRDFGASLLAGKVIEIANWSRRSKVEGQK
jgi:hypothetical protein